MGENVLMFNNWNMIKIHSVFTKKKREKKYISFVKFSVDQYIL